MKTKSKPLTPTLLTGAALVGVASLVMIAVDLDTMASARRSPAPVLVPEVQRVILIDGSGKPIELPVASPSATPDEVKPAKVKDSK